MAVRNFWIKADIDGRKTMMEGGPVRKDGGFSMTIFMRGEGGITKPLEIEGMATKDGRLDLYVNGKLHQRTRR